MTAGSRRIVDDKRASISWGVLFLIIFLVVWTGAIASTLTLIQHTWQYPVVNVLTTERWGRDFFFLISLSLAWLVPITAMWTLAYPAKGGWRGLHLAVCFLLFVYFAVIMIIWAMDYRAANLQTNTNARNLFNDDRWCLVNFAIAPSKCVNTANSIPPIIQAMLGVNGAMAMVFWMLVVFLFLLLIDISYIWIVYQGALNKYFELTRGIDSSSQDVYAKGPPDYQTSFPSAPSAEEDDVQVTVDPAYSFDDTKAPVKGGGGGNLALPSNYRKNGRRR